MPPKIFCDEFLRVICSPSRDHLQDSLHNSLRVYNRSGQNWDRNDTSVPTFLLRVRRVVSPLSFSQSACYFQSRTTPPPSFQVVTSLLSLRARYLEKACSLLLFPVKMESESPLARTAYLKYIFSMTRDRGEQADFTSEEFPLLVLFFQEGAIRWTPANRLENGLSCMV